MIQTSSIDPKEVLYYERLADTWWDQDGPFWPLHRLNQLRVYYLRDWICLHFARDPELERPLTGLTILDVGSGGGILSESMARLGARVTGIDVVERNIRIAALHAQSSALQIKYRHTTAEALAEAGERFDVVLNMEVVEHVADVDGFMTACGDLVADNGAMTVATINRTPLAWLVAIVGAELVLRWMPRGTHHYRKLCKPAEIERYIQLSGLNVIARTGVRVNPFKRSLHLSRFMEINYMMIATRD